MKSHTFFGLMLAMIAGSQAAQAGISEVNQWIKNARHSGAQVEWTPKASWVTELSQDQLRKMMGVKDAPTGHLEFEGEGKLNLPSSLDWRNKGGIKWTGPVMNQGYCGSCVAFATVATLEAQYSISAGLPWLHPTFSPQALFSCGGGSCDMGWMPGQAAAFLKHTGIPDEACMPYTSGSSGNDVSCSDRCSDAGSRNFKINNSRSPTGVFGGSVESVKKALQNGPLVTTLTVYSDFITYGSGVYRHVGGERLGGHAVSLVGYDDSKKAWLIRNSWGPNWGDNGYAWVSWNDNSGVATETWAFDIASTQNYLAVENPQDHAYVSGPVQLQAQVNSKSGHPVMFFLKGNSGKDVSVNCVADQSRSLASEGETCATTVEPSELKDGRYEIYALDQTTHLKSQVREFYVVNSRPELSLSFTAGKGTNPSAPMSGEVEFLVRTKSSPVPMEKVEFRAVDSNGKTVYVKQNHYVLPQMKFGWRTITVPNGVYKIYFHGEIPFDGKIVSVDSSSLEVEVKN